LNRGILSGALNFIFQNQLIEIKVKIRVNFNFYLTIFS